jgi:Flagellar-associated PapD-like
MQCPSEAGVKYPVQLAQALLACLQALEKAMMRHKEGLTQPQVFAGKVLQGASLTATPARPCFRDFKPGHTYTQTVTMTNVSAGRCTFKLLPMPDEFADVVAVDYMPPGHISAGLACDLHVTFKPRQNMDISTAIRLLASTGVISVPLTCLTKKASITMSENVIDFGQPVALGESSQQQIILKNAGALPVRTAYTLPYKASV